MRFISVCLLLLSCTASQAEDAYTVSYVYDGDTVELKHAGIRLKLRLTDIDAPERNQQYGQKARRALIKLCTGSNITINVNFSGMDKYGRHLGRLQCNQIDVSLYMAAQGHAWYTEKYSNDLAIKNAAAMARQKRIGLWGAIKPQAPWVWRHLHSNTYQPAN